MEKFRERKKNIISKTFRRCRSSLVGTRRAVAPEGCVSVRVGDAGDRYYVRTECLNHPSFRGLLDDAEMAYGYGTEGPIRLPCDVGQFLRLVSEVEQEMMEMPQPFRGCSSFSRSNSGYLLLSPSRPMALSRN